MGNDINPPNMQMFGAGIILLITGLFCQANIFGTMTNILGTVNRKYAKF